MELRQLHYFLAVADELHFGRAAERLHIVQSAVSQQVRRLERELGVDLFDRGTRTVTLTHAGREFLPRAVAVVDAEREALDGMAALCKAAVLRIGTSVGLGTRLQRVLAVFAVEAPEVILDLVSAPRAVRLRRVRDGELDGAFVRDGPTTEGVRLVPLWQDRLVAALPAHHRLAAEPVVRLADLAPLGLRIAPHDANPQLVDLVTGACRDEGFEPLLGPTFTTDQDTLAAIATGPPTWTVFYASQAEITPAPGIAYVPFAGAELGVRTLFAVPLGRTSPHLPALVEACRTEAGR